MPVLSRIDRVQTAAISSASGPAGLVQNLADGVKLIFKEDIIPGHIPHKFYFVLAPVIVFTTALVSFAVVPFADTLVLGAKSYIMQAIPLDIGILWFLAFTGFAVYGIILAGWSSHNKYGILGGLAVRRPGHQPTRSRWALLWSACWWSTAP